MIQSKFNVKFYKYYHNDPHLLGSVAEGGHAGANWVRRSITINTGFGDKRFRDGNIEELLIHEGAHVSLDNYHKNVSSEY